MSKEYKVDKQTLNDILAYEPKNRNKRQVFIENTIRAVLERPDFKDKEKSDKLKEQLIYKAIDYCNQITDLLNEEEVEFRVMELPSSLYPYATHNNEPPFVEFIPVAARSVKITVDDFKSLLKFIKKERVLALYMVLVHEKDMETEFALRMALTTQNYLEEDARFIELED